MCDYSLCGLPTRLAVEGERLVVHRFKTNSLGLASPVDLRLTAERPQPSTPVGFWARVKNWFYAGIEVNPPVVCIPPGARLVLRDIPHSLQEAFGVEDVEEITFVQLDSEPYHYRDAVRFNNGKDVLLQKLQPGQNVDVLSLSPAEEDTYSKILASASELFTVGFNS